MALSMFAGGNPWSTVHPSNYTADRYGQSSSSSSSSCAICSVCCCSMVVTKVGLFRVHGPLRNRCTGSGMSIVSPSSSITAISAPVVVSTGSTTSTFVTSYMSVRLIDHEKDSDSVSSSLTVNSFFCLTSVRIVKRIPRASGHLAATKLESILMDVTMENDEESCIRLF